MTILSLLQAHQISDEVEQELLKIFTDTEVFIHQDPQSVGGQRINQASELMLKMLLVLTKPI